ARLPSGLTPGLRQARRGCEARQASPVVRPDEHLPGLESAEDHARMVEVTQRDAELGRDHQGPLRSEWSTQVQQVLERRPLRPSRRVEMDVSLPERSFDAFQVRAVETGQAAEIVQERLEALEVERILGSREHVDRPSLAVAPPPGFEDDAGLRLRTPDHEQ